MSETASNIAKVRARLQQAAKENNRDVNSIQLLAVSKKKTVAHIREAYKAGLRDFGENYLQEAREKVAQLADLPIIWHFIGPLQSNKTRFVAEHFQWLHSLDRLKLATRLSQQRPSAMPPLNICIQVNIDHGPGKSGVSPDEINELALAVERLPGLALRGLMAIPEPQSSAGGEAGDGLELAFSRMGDLLHSLQENFPRSQVDTLSMGMSADLELAVAAGSTLVRIGTDIFGSRQ